MPVSWTPENERKFMLKLIHLVSNKDIDAAEFATHFPGATPRAITEHLRILRKEADALRGAPAVAPPAAPQVRQRGGAVKIKKEVPDEDGTGGAGAGADGDGVGKGEGGHSKKRGRKRKGGWDDVDAEGGIEGDEDEDGDEVVKKKRGRFSKKDKAWKTAGEEDYEGVWFNGKLYSGAVEA